MNMLFHSDIVNLLLKTNKGRDIRFSRFSCMTPGMERLSQVLLRGCGV